VKNKTLIGVCTAVYFVGATFCLGSDLPDIDQPRPARSSRLADAGCPLPQSPRLLAEQEGAPKQPEYIHIIQDTVKEGRFPEYESLQVERAKALAAANWARISIGLKPMTGPAFEVLRISFFNSFEELANITKELGENPALGAKLKEIDQKESLLLQSRLEIDARYRPKISYHGDFNWADMRFMSIIKIHLIPGHGSEYSQNRDIVIKAHNDAKLPENLAIYTINSGTLSSSYRILRPVTSLKGFDEMDATHGDKYEAVLGKENQEKLHELFAASVQTEEEEYFAFESRLSFTTPAWAGSNSAYWNSSCYWNSIAPK